VDKTEADAMENEPSTDSKGKAKAKATDTTGEAGDTGQPDRMNLISRVVDSTKGLLRDTIGASHVDASSTLLSNTGLGSKAQGLGSSSSATNLGDDAVLRTQSQGAGGTSLSSHLPAEESFRSLPASGETEQQFSEFASENALSLVDISRDPSQQKDFESSWQTPSDQIEELSDQNNQAPQLAYHDDGAEVRALLSDPNFFADMDDFGPFGMEETSPQTINDLFPQNFSADEQVALDQLRRTLPPPPVHRQTPQNHPLNLRPRSDEEKSAIEQNIVSILSGAASDDQPSTHAVPEAQSEQWLTDWATALSSYTDEVWGDMLPAVQETKAHLEEVRAGNASLDNKSRARLKMILGHLGHRTF
jgi:hypothetical protein